ncbi:hypothetical protein M406DRAFT_356057 [Cryphonectria parasitica EP155]|uniref:Uncharacterized protein n=1 Tax=Cryphonectria parasitica (strain ATCC 38755 / EP155) TaxID=660469 RepID=A0A9P5CPU9_CRYP1|nr:uncharacterized protein M406DRAFT_356057 [Cryphonectria parasitica EP155]KAF3765797.1 hypothetical protein M406DRAFT_356057 [Cryphonectria parasitica EP155]
MRNDDHGARPPPPTVGAVSLPGDGERRLSWTYNIGTYDSIRQVVQALCIVKYLLYEEEIRASAPPFEIVRRQLLAQARARTPGREGYWILWLRLSTSQHAAFLPAR